MKKDQLRLATGHGSQVSCATYRSIVPVFLNTPYLSCGSSGGGGKKHLNQNTTIALIGAYRGRSIDHGYKIAKARPALDSAPAVTSFIPRI